MAQRILPTRYKRERLFLPRTGHFLIVIATRSPPKTVNLPASAVAGSFRLVTLFTARCCAIRDLAGVRTRTFHTR